MELMPKNIVKKYSPSGGLRIICLKCIAMHTSKIKDNTELSFVFTKDNKLSSVNCLLKKDDYYSRIIILNYFIFGR